jgi:transcriptional regulator with XRE-family HTH domain
MDIGSAIKLVRNNSRMSQTDLADKSGLSPSYIHMVERGRRTLNLKSASAIAGALGLSLFMLIFIASEDDDLIGMDASARIALTDEIWGRLRKLKNAAKKERGEGNG